MEIMENSESMPHAGWYPTELLAWIQNQDPKKLTAIFFLAGKLIRMLTLELLLKKTCPHFETQDKSF